MDEWDEIEEEIENICREMREYGGKLPWMKRLEESRKRNEDSSRRNTNSSDY